MGLSGSPGGGDGDTNDEVTRMTEEIARVIGGCKSIIISYMNSDSDGKEDFIRLFCEVEDSYDFVCPSDNWTELRDALSGEWGCLDGDDKDVVFEALQTWFKEEYK